MKILLKKAFFVFWFFTLGNMAQAETFSSHLLNLQTEYNAHIVQHPANTFATGDSSLQVIDHQFIVVDVTVHKQADVADVKTRLEHIGMTHTSVYKKQISGLFAIDSLHLLNSVPDISWISSNKATRRVGPPGGAAFNAADPAMFTDVVRKRYAVDGSSVTIGVMSDSYDCLGGAQDDVASGDLPDDVKVLKEYPFCDTSGSDEGRAMMQLIHDVAPGAKLLYYTAFVSATDFAAGIQALADAGADIIVDDIGYFDMPMFQDGPIAQSVNEVKERGVSYFSSAGNNGRLSYGIEYQGGREPISFDQAHDFGKAAGSGSDFYQPITIPVDAQVTISLQWDDPAEIAGGEGAKTDIDFFLLDNTRTRIISSSQDNNIGHNPVERISLTNSSDLSEFYLYISHRAGPAPSYIKYVVNGPVAPWPVEVANVIELDVNTTGPTPVIVDPNGDPISEGRAVIVISRFLVLEIRTIGNDDAPILIDAEGKAVIQTGNDVIAIGKGNHPIWFVPDGFIALPREDLTIELFRSAATFVPFSINDYASHSSTLYGHPNADGAMAVGAIPYRETPWFGTQIDRSRIEHFSSAGGTPTFFDTKGKRLAEKVVRFKPEIIAPDDTDTTFFGTDENDTDANGFPNFQGTSAAAPHAAATAALVLEAFPFLQPDHVHLAMTRGSLDLHDPSIFTEEAPDNPDCAANTQFDYGTGCGLMQADRVFEVIIDAINSVFVSARTSNNEVTIGKLFTYTFVIQNASDQTLINARLHGIDLPDLVGYGDISGCLSIDTEEVSCLIPEIKPDEEWTVTIPVMPHANPAGTLRFEVDLLTDTNVDLSQTHRILEKNIISYEGDFDLDGCIDQTDWGILFGVFRTGSGATSDYDLTGDGIVTLEDLSALELLYTNPGGAACR